MGSEQHWWLHAPSVDAWFGPMTRAEISGERGARIRALYREGDITEVEDGEFAAAQAHRAEREALRVIYEANQLP